MYWIPTKMSLLVASVSATLVLSACGGGGSDTTPKVTYTSMVSFGDSLSDVGTYKVGTIAAVGGGRFTVNGTTTGPVNWTELLAGQVSLPAPCPAQTGLLSNIPQIPLVAVSPNANCTNYAQGSSRVTSPVGPNSYALQVAAGQTNIGLMAVPLVTQFSTHLAAHGNYTGTELVTVMAGANDVFMHINAVSSAAAGGAGAVGAARLAGWTTAEQNAVAAGGAAAVNAAATAAVTHAAQDALELAGYIQASVIGKGAKHVVVVNVPSIENTPFGQGSGAQALLNRMVTTFNSTLKTALSGTSGLLLVDAYTQSVDQYNNPAQYGITNVTVPACSTVAASATNPAGNILGGSSLACTVNNTLSGVDVSTYFYADTVHPTPAGYKLLDRYVAEQMAKVGWL
ncbi:SGNH/GDSL hydrolase family protein [Rhodoferax sp.]|uniref:SGNH/GDSL hydrolase family protein n=1 Tax=Rhodoferax sp. TaxID=50421 RepID=UPI0025E2EC40|nr:SGNH/GDSL hydrolase family protein [Rhodoferax sp.]